MENMEKDNSTGVPMKGSAMDMKTDAESAADKYEDFASHREDTRSVYPQQEQRMSGKRLFAFRKRLSFPFLLDRKKLVAGILIIAVLIISGVYLFRGKDKGSLTAANDEKVRAAMAAMKEVKSYGYEGKMDFSRTFKSKDIPYGVEYQIIYKGVAQKDNGGKPAIYSSLSYDTVRSANNATKETGIGMESAVVGDRKYIKLNNLDLAGGAKDGKASTLQNELLPFAENWYSVSGENYANFYDAIKDYALLPDGLDVLEAESVNDLDEIFNHNFLSSAEDMGSDPVGEIEATRYRVKLDATGAVEVISALATRGKEANADSTLEKLKNNTYEADKFDRIVDYLMRYVDMELWVGNEDRLIYRFQISGQFDDEAIAGFYAKLEEVYGNAYSPKENTITDEKIDFNIQYTLSNFNVSEVKEPEEAKDFNEVMEKLKSIDPSVKIDTSTSYVDTDTDGLSDEQEKLYGSDPSKPDTDGDGYKDGEEVRNGYDPVVAGSARLDYSKLEKKK